MITGVFFSFLAPPARWWSRRRRRRRRRRDSVHLNRRRGYSLCSVCQCCIQRGRRGEERRERERATHGHINPARLETCTHTHTHTHTHGERERNAIGSALISAASPPDRVAPLLPGCRSRIWGWTRWSAAEEKEGKKGRRTWYERLLCVRRQRGSKQAPRVFFCFLFFFPPCFAGGWRRLTGGSDRQRETERGTFLPFSPAAEGPENRETHYPAAAMPGFDYKFLEKPKRRFQCPLCSKAMREPVQVSTCGHRFCDTCLQEFLRYGVCVWERERERERDPPLCVRVCVCVCVCVQAIPERAAASSFGRATVNKGCVGVSSSPLLQPVFVFL